MKTLSLTTLFTTLCVAIGASLFAQSTSYSLDARIDAERVEILDLENPTINYTNVEYNEDARYVKYEGFIGDEIVYETGSGENPIALNIFSLTITDEPSKNAFTIHVSTAKGDQATLEVRDYNVGLLGYKLFIDNFRVGEGQTRLDLGPDRVKLETEYGELVDGHDAFNIMRFSPLEIKAINPFNLFTASAGVDQEVGSAIRDLRLKVAKWMGGHRGLRLATDDQAVLSTSTVCEVSSEDNPTEECWSAEGEQEERDAYLHVFFVD